MLSTDTESIVGSIGDYWDGWRDKQSEARLALWHSELLRLDNGLARQAVRELAHTSRFAPTIADFHKAYSICASKAGTEQVKSDYPKFSGWWLVSRPKTDRNWFHARAQPYLWLSAETEGRNVNQVEALVKQWLEQEAPIYRDCEFWTIQQPPEQARINPVLQWQREDREKAKLQEQPDDPPTPNP